MTTERALRQVDEGRANWRGPARLEAEEWLDQGRGSDADAAANLAEMARTNRWLGGLRALTRHLYPRLAATAGLISVLDIGAGSAEVGLALTAWARAHGRTVRVTALDWSARNLAVAAARTAHDPDLHLLRAEAGRLPLAAGSVDFVISTLFLHHLTPNAVVTLLRAAQAVARRGVIMSDLARGWLPLAAFRLVQPIFARHPFTRHDGALSIRRAYTQRELRALAGAAGLARARVHAHWPWRLTLVADSDAEIMK
jgi:SAM-dependent methyltransferase